MTVQFDPTAYYTTITDVDGTVYSLQNGQYYDQYGNIFISPHRNKNGYQGVHPTFVPRTTAQLAAAPTHQDLALGYQALFYDSSQVVSLSNPLALYSVIASGYVQIAGGGTAGGGGGVTTFVALQDASSADIVNTNASVGALQTTIAVVQALDATRLSVPAGWNASTNIPTLVSGTAAAYNAYIVVTAGTTTLDGITPWVVNDLALFGAGGVNTWSKVAAGGVYLGIYASTGVLPSAAASIGDSAMVGGSPPYTFYVSNGSAWVTPGGGGGAWGSITGTLASQTDLVDASHHLLATNMPALTGDVTTTAGAVVTTLAISGVTAGTYTKITVDAKGRATVGAAFAASDVTSVVGLTVSIGANTTITTGNQNTYNGMILEFAGNYTVTINQGLNAGFGFSYIPYSSGNSTLASDGTTTLNGSTTSQVRTSALVVGSVVQRVSNANQYLVI